MTTISRLNYQQLPGIIDTAVRAGVDIFAFARYVPGETELDVHLSPQEYRRVLEKADKLFRDYKSKGIHTYFSRKDHLWTLYDYEMGDFKIPAGAEEGIIYRGCNCGNSHVTILPTGDVYACRRVAESRLGNVLTDRLADLWINEMEQYRDFNKFEKCRQCELLSWCRGCPAVAKGINGSFYSADPQCWKIID